MKNVSKALLNRLLDIPNFVILHGVWQKKILQQGQIYISKDRPFLDKEKDSKTYPQIKEIRNCFSTDE